jgi:hypothetical protein
VVATTATDASGRYRFSNLRCGRYRLQFTNLPAHRALTAPAAGNDRALDSDPDPATGITPVFKLAQGVPNLAPATDVNAGLTDFEDQTLNAGLVGAYSVGDRVWQDNDGDGVLGPSDSGVAGVTVELMDSESHVLGTEVTSPTGSYSFDRLPAGSYKIRFSKVPRGLTFTSQDAGASPAIDSDVDQNGETAVFTLGSENPVESSIDAGLTSPSNHRGLPDSNRPPVDAAMSTSGFAPQIAIVGLALAIASTSCLLVARRRRKLGH